VLAAGDRIRSHDLYVPALLLIFAGALTKSAQFPFHFWLPNAMAAPTPASAYLHSATMVKAGVFLLVRFWPVLSGTDEWFFLLGLAGMCTLVLGAYFAIFQQDLKGLLAYSTISHLGLITMLLSFGSPLAAVAHLHMMNHATFKARHGGQHHRPRGRNARHAQAQRSLFSCRSRHSRCGERCHGGGVLNGFLRGDVLLLGR
jgi:multicomponent K+:H+ antiporter subunit A